MLLREGQNNMRLGIDFGTTNSAAAVYDGSQLHPVTMHNSQKEILPSLIYIDRQYQVTLGQEAAREYTRRETGRGVNWKSRSIGTIEIVVGGKGGNPITYQQQVFVTYDDAASGRLLQSIKTALRNPRYDGTQIFERYYTIDELIAMLLARLKESAEKEFGKPCNEVVIGRPVKFADDPHTSFRAEEIIYKAARKVGFKDISFHMEPIGALYVYHISTQERRKVLVFDFGGGTLDLTVAEVGGKEAPNVLSTRGILVGGDDLDKAIFKSLMPYFGEDSSRGEMLPFEVVDALRDWQTMPELTRPQYVEMFRRLKKTHKRPKTIDALHTLISKNVGFSLFREVERVKRELTDNEESELHFIYENINIHETITRTKFERMIAPLVKQVEEGIHQVLADAGTTPDEIDVVLRTGGSSLVPAYVRMLSDIFGAEKLYEMDPLVSVVGGLGIIAHENAGMRGSYRPKFRDLTEPLPFKANSQHTYELYHPSVDAKCYVERDTVIRKMPVDLTGLRAIRPANLDSECTDDDLITITLDKPRMIYVAYASSAHNIPQWLRSFKEEPDYKIEVMDDWWGIKELQVYSKEFPAGEVKLGANRAWGAEGRCDPHYLVIMEG
jgi:hypothetical chaperone protein